MAPSPTVLVTGATGYIGGRLVPALLAAGHEVRCLARDPESLSQHPWRDQVEVVRGDVLDGESLDVALAGCRSAYYLVHSMDGAPDFRERDRTGAANFRDACDRQSVDRIVYLGGLGSGERLSGHLASRQEVGAELSTGSASLIEVRAAVIIGSGSVSFEMMRHLTEVLPVMITPRWVRTTCQPIGIRNVLDVLVAALDAEAEDHRIWEVGGPDRLSYEQMMRIYAEEAGLAHRFIIPVPLLSPQLSKHWIGLVTPLPTGVAKPLVDSLRNEVVASDNQAATLLGPDLLPYREAVRRALRRSEDNDVSTRWSDAANPAETQPFDPEWAGATLQTDERVVESTADADEVYRAFARIGGDTGYYGFDWAWRLRGLFDRLIGGVGLRRGRRHPEELRHGESVDFWRVAVVEPGRRLQLRAEMRLPGEAWLEFVALEGDESGLRQTAYFLPKGLAGRLYWLALVPAHGLIFDRMARRIVAAAEA